MKRKNTQIPSFVRFPGRGGSVWLASRKILRVVGSLAESHFIWQQARLVALFGDEPSS